MGRHAPEVEPQPPVLRGPRVVGEEAVDQGLQALGPVLDLAGLVDDGRVEQRHLAVQDLAQDLGDPGEVIGQGAGGDAGRAGDVAHGRRRETALGDQVAGRVDDQQPPDLARLPLPVGGRPGRGPGHLAGHAHRSLLVTKRI